MKTTFKRTLSAAAAALVLAAAIPFNVYATSAVTPIASTRDFEYDAINGTSTYFLKALVMDEDANVPDVTFEYTIEPIANEITATGTTFHIKKGVITPAAPLVGVDANANNKVDTAESGLVPFKPMNGTNKTTTYDTIQTATNIKNNADTPAVVSDSVSFKGYEGSTDGAYAFATNKKKYARQEVMVDFSGVEFKEPGIYRYKITETIPTTPGPIAYDVTTTTDTTAGTTKGVRYLDVYVEDDLNTSNPGLKISGYVLQKTNVGATFTGTKPDVTINDDGTKSQGYINEYESYDITLSKKVTGNQGSRDEYFKFTVNITDAVKNTVYDVDVTTDAQETTGSNGITTATHTNPQTITANASGSATAEFWLRNDQSIVIKGLAAGTNYTITEANTGSLTLDEEGYKTDIVQYTDAALTTEDKTGTTLNYTVTAANRQIADAAEASDKYIEYTNNKNGTVPTGVLLSYTPAAVVGIIVIAGIIFLVRKRRAE